MSIREKPIYISNEVGRWLWLLAKAESFITVKYDGETIIPCGDRKITPDEIADQILRQAIREQHPQLSDHQKNIEKLEKELIENLRTNHENKTVSRTSDTAVES